MKFVAISDTHCRHNNLKLPKGDVLLHAGDITYKGEKSEVVDFLKWFDKQPYKHKIFIAGNHDFFFEREKEETIQGLMPKSVTYLKDSGIEINGIRVWGSPVTPWFYNWAFNRLRGPAIARHWKMVPPDTDVLLTHGPAFGILDCVINQSHVGCKDLMKKIRELKPKVHVCGHIHEAYGQEKKAGVHFYNASVLNEYYELTNPPLSFEL